MDLRAVLDRICAEALLAVDPHRAVSRVLAARGTPLLGDRPAVVLAFGKAAVPMAQAAVEFLGDRLEAGLAITKVGHGGRVKGVEVLEASHPEPDSRGCAAAERALTLLENTLTAGEGPARSGLRWRFGTVSSSRKRTHPGGQAAHDSRIASLRRQHPRD